jgi:hypothetical protein
MTSHEATPSVNAFFESYRTAFERLDATAIADHFAYPSHVTSDAREIGLVPVSSKQDWINDIERLLAMYRAIDFGSARVLDLALFELSPRVVQAMVRWALHDTAGGSLYDFQAMYTLVGINETLRIATIAHNEIPRYRECLGRLQSQRTVGDGSPGGTDHPG